MRDLAVRSRGYDHLIVLMAPSTCYSGIFSTLPNAPPRASAFQVGIITKSWPKRTAG